MELIEANKLKEKQLLFLNAIHDSQMQHIIELINVASKTNEFYIYYNNISYHNINKLKTKGYKVEFLGKNSLFTHKISWD